MIEVSKCPRCGHVVTKLKDVVYRKSGSEYVILCPNEKCKEEYYATEWVKEKLEEQREYFG